MSMRSTRKGKKSRERTDSVESASEYCTLVEFNYSDTFTTLLEKCLTALNVRFNDSSSTNFSNDEKSSNSRQSVTKQALLYDSNRNLVTMLGEVREEAQYFVEIIDRQLLAFNHFQASPAMEI